MKKGKTGAGHMNNHVRGKQKKLQLVSTEQERIKFALLSALFWSSNPRPRPRLLFISVSGFCHPVSILSSCWPPIMMTVSCLCPRPGR